MNFDINNLPRQIDSGLWDSEHLQGIAVDPVKGYIYYSYTMILVKARLDDGVIIGWAGGLFGHLGCIDFNDENGKVPRSTRRRALELMRLGCYSELLSSEELHVKNAKKENAMLTACGIGEPGPYDDDATHIEEHCRFALGQEFIALRRHEPELCRAFDTHIALHAKRLGGEEDNIHKEQKGNKNER